MQPRPIRLTVRPVRPRRVYSMSAPPTANLPPEDGGRPVRGSAVWRETLAVVEGDDPLGVHPDDDRLPEVGQLAGEGLRGVLGHVAAEDRRALGQDVLLVQLGGPIADRPDGGG